MRTTLEGDAGSAAGAAFAGRRSPAASCPRGRPGLADAMILLAAIAVGLAWARGTSPRGWGWDFDLLQFRPRTFGRLLMRIPLVIQLTLPALLSLTLACLALHLRRPRPAWRDALRRPGFAVCLAAALALAVAAPWPWLSHELTGAALRLLTGASWAGWSTGAWLAGPRACDHASSVLTGAAEAAGFAALGARIALARAGDRGSGWLDRLGRLLGMAWIAMIPLRPMLSVVSVLTCAGIY